MNSLFRSRTCRAVIKLFVLAILAAGVGFLIRGKNPLPHSSATAAAPYPVEAALFAPSDNLEQEDIAIVASARSTIDIAMYAFTDQRLASALEDAADRGVKIRIYRDPDQLANELERSSRDGSGDLMEELAGHRGIQVKVKQGWAYMHLKAYCVDGQLLRTGSANWSRSGETEQDNDLYLIPSKSAAANFEKNFNKIWSRPNNQTL